MNILLVNQSVADICASFCTLLTAVVRVDGTAMSRDSSYDLFLCRIWHTRIPLWSTLITSTYGILMTAVERYIAVIYPVWYNVRMKSHFPSSYRLHQNRFIVIGCEYRLIVCPGLCMDRI